MHTSCRLLFAWVFLPLILFGVACGGHANSGAPSAGVAATARSTAGSNVTASAGTASAGFFDMAAATTTPSGLKYIDTVVGTGDPPSANQSVVVNYTGRLASNGKVFDSTSGRGPASFAWPPG